MVMARNSWLLSIVTSVVLAVTMLFTPTTVMAATGSSAAQDPEYTYVNSDGEEVASTFKSKDGFVYRIIDLNAYDDDEDYDDDEELGDDEESGDDEDLGDDEDYGDDEDFGEEEDPYLVAEVLGNVNASTKKELTIPAELGGYEVYSIAIDPRYPVGEENYNKVKTILLPATLGDHHYLRFFNALTAVTVDAENDYYKNIGNDGVLYYDASDGEGDVCGVEFYPRGKEDTSWSMPEGVTEGYRFFEECPIEHLSLPASLENTETRDYFNLRYLEDISVAEGSENYSSVDGVLFNKDKTVLIKYPQAKSGEAYSVPDGVQSFDGSSTFYNAGFTSLSLPGSIEDENYAIEGDIPNLKTVEFRGESAPPADEDGDYGFWGLRSLMLDDEGQPNPDAPEIKYPDNGTGYEEFIAWLNSAESEYDEQEENYWEEDPYFDDSSEQLWIGQAPLVEGEPAFGVDTMYQQYKPLDEGDWSNDLPTEAGTYLVRLVVDETDEYTGLESEEFEFEITAQSEELENEIESYSETYFATYGEPISIKVKTAFGEPQNFQYKEVGADDAEWKAADAAMVPGQYYFRFEVPALDGKYTGLKVTTDWTESSEAAETSEWTYMESILDIEKAQNSWEEPLECESVYEGTQPEVKGKPKYGSIDKIEWYADDGEWENDEETGEEYYTGTKLTSIPTKAGSYMVYAEVNGSDFVFGMNDYAYFSILGQEDIDEETADGLVDAIAALPIASKITEENAEEVKAEANRIKAQYDVLSDQAKKRVRNYNKLQKILQKIHDLENPQIAEATAAIDALPAVERLTAADADAVRAAKAKYDSLTEEQQAAIDKDTKDVLTEALEQIVRIEVYEADAAKAKQLKVSGLKVKAQKKKKAKVTWKVNTQATGYVIQYSLKKNFKKSTKKVTVKTAKTKKQTVKKLKAKKKYYFRIATITKVQNPMTGKIETIQGKWSKAKKIKAKK